MRQQALSVFFLVSEPRAESCGSVNPPLYFLFLFWYQVRDKELVREQTYARVLFGALNVSRRRHSILILWRLLPLLLLEAPVAETLA